MNLGNDLTTLIMAFARISTFLFLLPIFGKGIPKLAKIVFSLGVSFAVVDTYHVHDISSTPQFIGYVIMQVLIGFTLAKIVEMLMSIPSIAGTLLDLELGYSAAQIMDPATKQVSSLIGTIYNVLFVLIFLSLDGIQQLVLTVVRSFELTESLMYLGNKHFLDFVFGIVIYMLSSAIQIALPMIGAMFLITMVFLIVGKATPPMANQIFTNMYGIKMVIGLLLLALLTPFLGNLFENLTNNLMDEYVKSFNYIFKK